MSIVHPEGGWLPAVYVMYPFIAFVPSVFVFTLGGGFITARHNECAGGCGRSDDDDGGNGGMTEWAVIGGRGDQRHIPPVKTAMPPRTLGTTTARGGRSSVPPRRPPLRDTSPSVHAVRPTTSGHNVEDGKLFEDGARASAVRVFGGE